MNMINAIYKELIKAIISGGYKITTRGSETYSLLPTPGLCINDFPLITTRKTAWKKALREYEWFMSGDAFCPEELLDWWDGQLNNYGCYKYGYPRQLRLFGYCEFDQIRFVLDALKNNPNSRRIIMTTWHPHEMSDITITNNNPRTPTTCHGSFVQFFVRDGELIMKHYQRSADMLLGVPHNLVQYWALLLFFAHHANLKPGYIIWDFGDAHIYTEESHIKTANEIIEADALSHDIELVYEYSGELDDYGLPKFKTDDFKLKGTVPEPIVKTRPKLIA